MLMSNPIKLVLFDVGGVLLDADLDRYIQIGCAMFETNPEALQREVGRLVPGLEKGLLSSEQFWKEIGESLWRSGEGRPAFGTSFSGIWADIMRSSLELDPKVVRIAQAVKDNGFGVGILSNAVDEHAQLLEEMGVYAPFSPCIVSCRVGMRKPDGEIYLKAAREAGLKTKQCLFIDDMLHNVEAARQTGMQALQFTEAAQLYADLVHLHIL